MFTDILVYVQKVGETCVMDTILQLTPFRGFRLFFFPFSMMNHAD